MEPGFERVVRSDDVGGPPFTRVSFTGGEVLLTRLADGRLTAFATACPHQGHELTRGFLTPDGCIECPHHFYAYDPTTGRNTFPGDEHDLRLPVHEVREADGWIWLRTGGLDT